MTELSTVAGAIKALSFDRETQAYEQGSRFARNKLERLEVVTSAANTLGAEPSYEEWEAYRVQWSMDTLTKTPTSPRTRATKLGRNLPSYWTSFMV